MGNRGVELIAVVVTATTGAYPCSSVRSARECRGEGWQDIERFTAISGDRNPLHSELTHATAAAAY